MSQLTTILRKCSTIWRSACDKRFASGKISFGRPRFNFLQFEFLVTSMLCNSYNDNWPISCTLLLCLHHTIFIRECFSASLVTNNYSLNNTNFSLWYLYVVINIPATIAFIRVHVWLLQHFKCTSVHFLLQGIKPKTSLCIVELCLGLFSW